MRTLTLSELSAVSGGTGLAAPPAPWEDPFNDPWRNPWDNPILGFSEDNQKPDTSKPGPGDGTMTTDEAIDWILDNPAKATREFVEELAQALVNDADKANDAQAEEWLNGNPMAGSLLGP